MRKDTIVQIILNVTLSSIFICAFYFIYAAKVEGDIVQRQCSNIIKNYTDIYQAFVGGTQFSNCDSLIAPDASHEDAEVAKSNEKLLEKALKFFGGGFVVAMLVITLIWKTGKPSTIPFKTILGRAMLNLTAVGAVEYVFLKYIIGNYINIDNSTINGFAVDAIMGIP